MINCQQSYHPSATLTNDEQLFPIKARCVFTQDMPNEPRKFGIKFGVLADSSTPYVLNIRPCLGKHFDEDHQGLQLGQYVVLKLTELFSNKGYNLTTDNFLLA